MRARVATATRREKRMTKKLRGSEREGNSEAEAALKRWTHTQGGVLLSV